MLMGERLVDADVVVTPAEVGGCTRFYACARAAGDGIHVDVIVEHQVAGQRQQCQLDGSCKAAGIGYVLALADGTTVQLGESVDERIVIGLQAVIHGKVYHFQALGQGVGLHELAGIAVSGAEKQHIDGVQWQLVGENHIGFTNQALMHGAQLVAGVAGTVYKNNLGIRMPQQDTYKFTGRVTGSTYYTYFYHLSSGIISAQIRYANRPMHPAKNNITKMMRIIVTSISKYSAKPAHTPKIFLSFVERRSFLTSDIVLKL